MDFSYYHADRLFHQGKFYQDCFLAVREGRTHALLSLAQLPKAAKVIEVEGILSPGFVETQANGGGGVLFNDMPTLEGLRTIIKAHRLYGTVAMLPTFISDTQENFHRAIEVVAQGVVQGERGLVGGHFEGPFLHPEKKGTHREDFLRLPDARDKACFAKHAKALRHSIVSVAPERVGEAFIAYLVDLGYKLNVAHSMATHEDLLRAKNVGLTGITHLFNAMRPFSGRDPGPIGSALSLDLYAGIIADGVHSHPYSLESAYRLLGRDRLMLVTDSMHTIGTDIQSFVLTGQKVFVKGNCLVNEHGSLAGAHVTLLQCVKNAVRYMKADLESALCMAISTPARYISCAQLASITGRMVDDVIALDANLDLIDWQ